LKAQNYGSAGVLENSARTKPTSTQARCVPIAETRGEMKEATRQQGGFFRLGRIVPTEAKPSELSGEILWARRRGVKAKSQKGVNHFLINHLD
jgi:hypothetical protein